MTPKSLFLSLLFMIIVDIGLVLAATLGDIMLTVASAFEMTSVCFAVAGVFAGLFCYSFAMEKLPKEKRQQLSLWILVMIAVISILLFYPVAPLSGSDYSLAFKCFAITQLLMAVFLWWGKFYRAV